MANYDWSYTELEGEIRLNLNTLKVDFEKAYICINNINELALTNTFVKVDTGWTLVLDPPKNFIFSNGDVTFEDSGVYKIDIQRIYINNDLPSIEPVRIYIETRINEIAKFDSDDLIGAATEPLNPCILTFTTSSIVNINAGDILSIYVKALMGEDNPVDCNLKYIRLTINKIDEI